MDHGRLHISDAELLGGEVSPERLQSDTWALIDGGMAHFLTISPTIRTPTAQGAQQALYDAIAPASSLAGSHPHLLYGSAIRDSGSGVWSSTPLLVYHPCVGFTTSIKTPH